MRKIFTIFLATIAIATFAQTPPKGNLDTDKAALLEMYAALNGPNWIKTISGVDLPFNWSAETDILDFIGVTVFNINGVDRVTDLDLSKITNLEGSIPAAIGKLDELHKFDIGNNLYLTGSIPDEFYNLSALVSIGMGSTSISGSISTKIGQLTNLNTIFMEKNPYLTGGIPDGIGKCTKLTYIRLADNRRMTGTISNEIGKCTILGALQCERSNFTGPIPVGLTTLPKLQYLNLNDNYFTSAPNFAAAGARFPSAMAEFHYNLIPFGDLLPMKDFTRAIDAKSTYYYFRFIEQRSGLKLIKDTLKVRIGDPLVIDIDALLPNHGGVSFKWFYNNVVIGTGKKLNLTMSNATVGDYNCEITTDQDILNSGICPMCTWQNADNTINPRGASAATNTTAKLKVLVDNGTGLTKNTFEQNIRVVNNSTPGSFNIYVENSSIMGAKFNVLNLNGQVIQSGAINGNVQQVDINAPKGIYLFQFFMEGKYAAIKVII
jgi:hypothetical protein